jgi:hypothetical protein
MWAAETALARWLLFPEREPLPPVVATALSGDVAGDSGDVLLQLARTHGLAPLLHYRSKKAGIAFPPAAAAAIAADYHASLARNTYMYQELARMQGVAGGLGADLLVLKGAHLAARLYPTIAARPMVDVDLLVRREQVPVLVTALTARDYQVVSREPRPGARLDFGNQILLAHRGRADYGCLALHWGLLDFPYYQQRLRMQDFWERAVPCELPGMTAKVLDATDLLVYLCAHVALHHQWSRLIWLCDIALLLRQMGTELNWERSVAVARAGGLTLALGAALRRASGELGVPIPAEVWQLLTAATIGSAERYAWQELTQEGRGAGQSFWAKLRLMHGTRARLNFAFAHLLPSPAYMRRRYQLTSNRQLPAAYARRWLRGMASLRPHVPRGSGALAGKTQTR